MKLDVDFHEIHLWCAYFDEINDEALLSKYRNLLNIKERQQERRFYFPRDQRRYLVTRALVRIVLSWYAPIAPHNWTFDTGRYGKPTITNDEGWATEISFNISHTDGLIVLGITRRHALGVDAENLRTREPSIEIADSFFAPEEAAALRLLPEQQRRRRFYEYWTLKESYIKARGKGLALPLDRFCFKFSEHSVEISIHPDLCDLPSNWRFWQLDLAPDFLTAICLRREGNKVPKLRLMKIVPLISYCVVDYMLSRTSVP
jgi:4'-phosphopantetheinyl transferase